MLKILKKTLHYLKQNIFQLVILNLLLIGCDSGGNAVETSRTSHLSSGLTTGFMEDVTLHNYDTDGSLLYILTSNWIILRQKSNIFFLENPRIKLFRKNGNHWLVNSLNGEIKIATNELLLKDGVSIAYQYSGMLRIMQTPKLWVNTDRMMANTNENVFIFDDKNKITGKGATIDLNENKMNIHANVKSIRDEKNKYL